MDADEPDPMTRAAERLAGRLAAEAVARLMARASGDPGLRDDLRDLARALLESLGTPAATAPTTPEPASGPGPGPERTPEPPAPSADPTAADGDGAAPSPPPEPPAAPRTGPLPPLTLGQPPPPETRPSWTASPGALATAAAEFVPDSDLPALEDRCRLKARALRWAVTRGRRIADGADVRDAIAPRDRELEDEARALDAALWMGAASYALPADAAAVESCARMFAAVADSVALVRRLLPNADADAKSLEAAIALLAEAQSALRVAVGRIGGPSKDADQFRAYTWLRSITSRRRIFVRRHMKLDDPADPEKALDLGPRIAAIGSAHETIGLRGKRQKKLLSQLRYHAGRMAQGGGTDHDANKLVATIDELLAEGVPPSAVEIREPILPILDALPDPDDDPRRGVNRVLRAIDEYLGTRPTAGPPEEGSPAEEPTPEVAEAARLLEGREVVLIGGHRRAGAAEALEAAFRLEKLTWLETREHESIDWFEPRVARPSVALVLLAIRWSSHAFGEVKSFCDHYGKPLVRLPGGYNPNQAAVQILRQAANQLVRPAEAP